MLDETLEILQSVDWNDIEDVALACQPALKRLSANRLVIGQLLDKLRYDEHLFSLCEHYDILDKLVLWDDHEAGYRIRLHIFLPGYFDRPHNHRWSYSSIILTGRYQHVLYGDAQGSAIPNITDLRPQMVRTEEENSVYTLQHTMVHSVSAEPYTVSLIIRGPSVKSRFFVMDRGTGESWWQYGSEQEGPEERAAKQITHQYLAETIDRLGQLGIGGAPSQAHQRRRPVKDWPVR